MDEELDVIRNQMEETRASLADKLEALEDQLRGTVEGATSTVSDTVESVKDTVETVKETFNVARHVERRPWVMVGGAFAVGYLTGCLVLPRRPKKHDALPPPPTLPVTPVAAPSGYRNGHNGHKDHKGPNGVGAPSGASRPVAPRREPKEGPLEEALRKLSGLALGGLMGVVRQMVPRLVPEAYVPDANRLVDQMTTKLGGKPVPESREEEYAHPRSKGADLYG